MQELYAGETFPLPNGNDQFSDEEHQEVRRNYSAMVENIDRNVGLYLDLLEERGELENTLIIYSSDHGEMLGDHNGWSKSLPWHESASVPMVISGPGVQKGVTCDLPTTNLDVTATSLDYAKLDIPDDMDSRSLRNLLEGKTKTHREVVLSGLGKWRLAYDGRYKYVEGFEDTPQLFDLNEDPNENNNLINDSKHAEHIERLKTCLM
jgi:arylsulfatase A-like enzyme